MRPRSRKTDFFDIIRHPGWRFSPIFSGCFPASRGFPPLARFLL